MFLARGFVFTHEAVREGEAKLAPLVADELRKRRRGGVGETRGRAASTQSRRRARARLGAVSFLHRFGSALNLFLPKTLSALGGQAWEGRGVLLDREGPHELSCGIDLRSISAESGMPIWCHNPSRDQGR